jgi:predicted transcriptional regulator of viral defense system
MGMIRIVGYDVDISDALYHYTVMTSEHASQHDRAVALLEKGGMVRLSEFIAAGITAATISRMKAKGLVVQISRGLYQLPGAPTDSRHALAETAKIVPKGVICLVSALAFHELTDTIPSRVWTAIGAKDRKPATKNPPLQIVRFNETALHAGIEEHRIEGVPVQIFNPAKTVVDMFRYRQRAGTRYQKSPGLNLALEAMREALRQRKATPSEIARYAQEGGVWKALQPYLEAFTANA